jgi:hypothetical protein
VRAVTGRLHVRKDNRRTRDTRGMILDDTAGRHTESQARNGHGRSITHALENHWRTDAELATTIRVRTRWPVPLTAFSRSRLFRKFLDIKRKN